MPEYIEREALIKRLQENFNNRCKADSLCKYVIDKITTFPAAEVEPVKHARWVAEENDDVYFTCSYCGCEISTSWNYDDLEWNFCPECGRDMAGGTDNG